MQCPSISQPLPFSRPLVLRPRFAFRVRHRKVRVARDAGVLVDPRASVSREAEAERSSLDQTPFDLVVPQVRHFSSVPRAVFLALYEATPGGVAVSGSLGFPWVPNHRCGGLGMP